MMKEEQQEPSTIERIGAVTLAMVLLVVAACLVAEFTQLNDKTVVGIFTYSGFGVCVLAWRWPRTFTGPIKRAIGKSPGR